MRRHLIADLEFLAALLHGRRARMAEGARLRALCEMRSLREMTSALSGSAAQLESAGALERELVEGLAGELAQLAGELSGAGAQLLEWLLVRFRVENLKLLVRAVMTEVPGAEAREHLVALPKGLTLDLPTLSKAKSIQELADLMPKGLLRGQLRDAIDLYHEQPRSFFFEAALDVAYFKELFRRLSALSSPDRMLLAPVFEQEVDIFHFMLVTRGKFLYEEEPEALLPLHVPGTRISRARFVRLMSETSAGAATARLVGAVIEPPRAPKGVREGAGEGIDPAEGERLAWTRFWRLAHRAFRQSHMGLAAVVAYLQLRRVEVMNLTTLAEGIRLGVPRDVLCARFIPYAAVEVVHA